MRHRVATKTFNRNTKQRKALLVNLVRQLVEHGEITTTKEKAKEIKRIADKMIHKAKVDTIAVRRGLHSFFGKRDVVNTLVERVAPLMADRVSGFTTSYIIGERRGDNTTMVKLSLVAKPEVVHTLKNVSKPKVEAEKKAVAPKKAAAAKPAVKKAPAKAKKAEVKA